MSRFNLRRIQMLDLQNSHDPFHHIPPGDVLEILTVPGKEGERVSIEKALQLIPK